MGQNGQVTWNREQFTLFVRLGVAVALGKVADAGHSYWDNNVPVSTDPRTSGGLRDSWFNYTTSLGENIVLVVGASAPYAVYVELGTTKMAPRAPLRQTAGNMVAILPWHIKEALATD